MCSFTTGEAKCRRLELVLIFFQINVIFSLIYVLIKINNIVSIELFHFYCLKTFSQLSIWLTFRIKVTAFSFIVNSANRSFVALPFLYSLSIGPSKSWTAIQFLLWGSKMPSPYWSYLYYFLIASSCINYCGVFNLGYFRWMLRWTIPLPKYLVFKSEGTCNMKLLYTVSA